MKTKPKSKNFMLQPPPSTINLQPSIIKTLSLKLWNRKPNDKKLVYVYEISVCVCGSGPETRDHLFFHCSVSASIWNTVLLRFGRHLPFSDWPDMLVWISSGSGRFSLTLKKLDAQTMIFYIWKERNARLHSSTNSTPTTVFQRIDRSVRDSILARSSRQKFKGLLSQWFTFE